MTNFLLGLGMAAMFGFAMFLGWMIGYYTPDKPKKNKIHTGFHSSDPVCPHALYYDDCPLCRH